jgi:hypothetical protein
MDFTEISLDFMEIEWEFRTFPQWFNDNGDSMGFANKH